MSAPTFRSIDLVTIAKEKLTEQDRLRRLLNELVKRGSEGVPFYLPEDDLLFLHKITVHYQNGKRKEWRLARHARDERKPQAWQFKVALSVKVVECDLLNDLKGTTLDKIEQLFQLGEKRD